MHAVRDGIVLGRRAQEIEPGPFGRERIGENEFGGNREQGGVNAAGIFVRGSRSRES